MQRRIGDLDRVHDHLLEVVSEQSVSLENLSELQNRAETYQLETARALAEMESTDVAEAILQMQATQNALQFTYAASVQLMQTSVLDFLT